MDKKVKNDIKEQKTVKKSKDKWQKKADWNLIALILVIGVALAIMLYEILCNIIY